MPGHSHRTGIAWILVSMLAFAVACTSAPPEDPGSDGSSGLPEEPAQEESEPEEPAVRFAGDTITLIVPFGAGGGVDTSARLAAQFLGDHLPGNPRVEVVNNTGGGGAIAMIEFETRTEPDGLTMAVTSPGLVFRWASGQEGHDYDLGAMRPVAAQGEAVVAYGRPELGSMAEILERGETLRVGHSAGMGSLAVVDYLAADVLGFPHQPVHGYDGYGEVELAVLRGEVDAGVHQSNAYLASAQGEVEAGNLIPLYQTGFLEGDSAVPHPGMPEAPLLHDIYEDIKGENILNSPGWPGLAYAIAANNLGFTFWLPAGTPDEIFDTIATAFENMANSDTFVTTVREQTGTDPIMSYGRTVEELFRETMLDTPDTVLELLQQE